MMFAPAVAPSAKPSSQAKVEKSQETVSEKHDSSQMHGSSIVPVRKSRTQAVKMYMGYYGGGGYTGYGLSNYGGYGGNFTLPYGYRGGMTGYGGGLGYGGYSLGIGPYVGGYGMGYNNYYGGGSMLQRGIWGGGYPVEYNGGGYYNNFYNPMTLYQRGSFQDYPLRDMSQYQFSRSGAPKYDWM